MPNTIKFLGTRRAAGNNNVIKRYQVTLSGSYTAGGAVGVAGETLNFNGVLNPGYAARVKLPSGPPAARLPANTDFAVADSPAGYTGQIEQNAVAPTPANFVLRIFAGGSGAAAPAELASGAYAAALIATPFVVEVQIPQKYS